MVQVKLSGLKIATARGKYYVYRRDTGEALIQGFVGSMEDLRKRLAEPDMIGAYNVGRKRSVRTAYPEKSLGWLVAWFIDPEKCDHFKRRLSEVTQSNYKEGLAFLELLYDTPLTAITSADIYAARNKASQEKWPAFADKMVTALSTMFSLAVELGWMVTNPAKGVRRAYKPNPNANREWRPEEWSIVFDRAPLKLKIPMMIARHVGYRSQSIVRVQWSNYQADPYYEKCFRMVHRKNSEPHWVPASPELQDFLNDLTQTSTRIATKHDGTPWRDEEQLQKQFSNFIDKLEKAGLISEPGLTLHGLRVTYATGIKRAALERGEHVDNAVVAAALGDRDQRMGDHYTRHVENELKVIQAFPKPNKRKKKK